MKDMEIICVKKAEFSSDDKVKKEYERRFLLSVYQSLYNAGRISFEQLKYLENINRKHL